MSNTLVGNSIFINYVYHFRIVRPLQYSDLSNDIATRLGLTTPSTRSILKFKADYQIYPKELIVETEALSYKFEAALMQKVLGNITPSPNGEQSRLAKLDIMGRLDIEFHCMKEKGHYAYGAELLNQVTTLPLNHLYIASIVA